mmetsp:Transcript_34140/g.77910  ORF Transcript_34140/g.77910 Transcript_34140/m.77910 type:complete len:237 (-) Transcript_34140:382-1092(-)
MQPFSSLVLHAATPRAARYARVLHDVHNYCLRHRAVPVGLRLLVEISALPLDAPVVALRPWPPLLAIVCAAVQAASPQQRNLPAGFPPFAAEWTRQSERRLSAPVAQDSALAHRRLGFARMQPMLRMLAAFLLPDVQLQNAAQLHSSPSPHSHETAALSSAWRSQHRENRGHQRLSPASSRPPAVQQTAAITLSSETLRWPVLSAFQAFLLQEASQTTAGSAPYLPQPLPHSGDVL